MIPSSAVYLFFFVAGGSIGWITCAAIKGYLYEKHIRDNCIELSTGVQNENSMKQKRGLE